MFRFIRQTAIFRLAVGCVVLAGLVLALFLASSPSVHAKLHRSDAVQHECLATVLHAGGCEDAVAPPTFATFIAFLFQPASVDRSAGVESVFLAASVFEHAPPVVS
jgi:hypothetical protein